ncbi:MAG: insulinase family protein [Proteobacteria bacterium]|nr:insulinase family protein [Pseudomonadota bacterium]
MRLITWGAVLSCALACVSAPAATRTHEYMLDNGLKLLVQEDHRAHVAVVQVWYRVGSSYEHDGITGVSHALEHLMFKGTPRYAAGKFATTVAAHGGRQNAFTSSDYTAYYEEWSADNVELSFDLEADRMRNLVIDEETFKKEINVVLEERRLRTDDSPQSLAVEATQAVAYLTSPYRYPVIGWEADIKQMSAADLRAWYQRWYGPNNAIVVVVGDVDPDAVHALAKKYFGPLAKSDIAPPKARPEIAQNGTKRVTLNSSKARVPYLVMGYKAPVLAQAMRGEGVEESEAYALDVLAAMLTGDNSARLKRELVRGREIAAEVSAGVETAARLPTLFTFNAVPAQGVSLEKLEQAIVEQIDQLASHPPTAAELERIKTQVVADTVFERDSMMHEAMTLGALEAVGLGWKVRDTYVDKIEAVTAEQVLAVAKKYLVPAGLTVAYLKPEQAR